MARQLEKLSALKVNRATTPGYLGDGGGLYLQISPSGSKSWVFRFQQAKRSREMGLGALHTFGLKEARERAQRCRQLVAGGVDPIEEKKADRQRKLYAAARVLTFGRCAELYIDTHRNGWRNPKHTTQWSATLTTYCEPIWKLPVDAVDTALVMKCLDPIWTTKTETASRLRGRMESVLAWATVRGLRAGDNPAAWRNHLDQLLPARNKVQKVEHRAALPYAEAAAFMVDLRQRDSLAARVLELQILTASRPGEAAGAQWAEFDLQSAVWTIPAGRMKAGKEHRIPLAPALLTLLQSLVPTTPTGKRVQVVGHVFPGVKGRPLTTAAAMKLLKELRPGLTAHGFRSTFRDWAAETTNHPREVIEAAMAHRLKDAAEAAYQRGDLLQRRAKLMNGWARYCGGMK